MSVVDKTCRTCGKTFDLENGSSLCALYDSIEYEHEKKMILEEFDIWELNISQNDGLPQKICLTCFDSFCQIHNFRTMCIEAQMNFSEMCTGLDIIIKNELATDDEDYVENDSEQLVIVQEHYTFPGDEQITASTEEETNNIGSPEEIEDPPKQLIDCGDKENEALENLIDLKQHKCEFCMLFVSFDDPEELNKHYNELHSSVLPYNCPKCDLRFDKFSKRNSHARSHFDVVPLECKHCGKKMRGDDLLMAEHVAYYHVDKNRKCPICDVTFENISLKKYYYHMMWHDESKLLKCKFCDKKFIQISHLRCHEKTHTSETKHICKHCGLGFKNSIHLSKHILKHDRKELIECPKCPKKYFTKIGFHLHNRRAHDPNKKPIRCDICDRTFGYPHDLVTHNHKKHGAPARKAAKRTIRPGSSALRLMKKNTKKEFVRPYKCDKCDEAYVLEVQLLRHRKIHDEYRPHQCEFCPKSFKREAHLKLHVDNIHFHKKPHKCSLCPAAFVQKSHLNDHHAVNHENIRNHQCKVCQKKFGTQQILKIHMVIHSNERPFICKICNKGFKQMMVLKSHMNHVHLTKKKIERYVEEM